MVLDRVLALAGHDDDRGDARGDRLLDHVLDDRLVDERQHFLGLRLRGRQEAGSEPGGREDGLADLRRFVVIRRNRTTQPRSARERPVLSCAVMLDLKFVVENRDTVLSALAARGQGLATIQAFPGLEGVDPWALDGERRALIQETEALRYKQRSRGRGDRPPRQGRRGRLGAEGRDEGRRRAHQAGRGAPRGGQGRDRALPAGGAEPARRERAGRKGRHRQPGDPSRRRAARVRFRAPRARRSRQRARDPRLRAGGAALRRALRRLLGRRARAWSGR